MSVKNITFQIPKEEVKYLKFDHILTSKQNEKKAKCIGKGVGMSLTLSIPQMKKINKEIKQGGSLKEYKGGFIFTIPLLLAGLSAAGALAGGSAAIAKTVIDAKKNREELQEQKRHNAVMEAKKNGEGVSKRGKKKYSL